MSVIEAAPTLRSNRAGNFRTWHFSDLTARLTNVGSWGQSRPPGCAPGLLSLTQLGHPTAWTWAKKLLTLGLRALGDW